MGGPTAHHHMRWRPTPLAHAFGHSPSAATCSGWDSTEPSVGKAAPARAAPVHTKIMSRPPTTNDTLPLTREYSPQERTSAAPPIGPHQPGSSLPAFLRPRPPSAGRTRRFMQLQAPVGRTFSDQAAVQASHPLPTYLPPSPPLNTPPTSRSLSPTLYLSLHDSRARFFPR